MKYRLTRDVAKAECPWLSRDFKAGETVYRHTGATYGALSPDGTAVTLEEDTPPFFELPNDSLEEDKG